VHYFNADGPIDPFRFQSGAIVFGDGSVVEPTCELLARGGWSAIETDEEGNLIRGMRGSIPSSLPQTAVLTEHHALMNMVEHIETSSEGQQFFSWIALLWFGEPRTLPVGPKRGRPRRATGDA
jgi:hypothetical protein